MKSLRLSWRFFWSRRSRFRIMLTCILMALTLLAIVWLVLPPEWQRQAQNGIAFVARWVSILDTRTLLVALIGLCVVEGLGLLIVPSYRKHGYLVTAPSLIPLVSVYLDAENQLTEPTIRPFMDYLVKYLDGRRADLLFFLDAATEAPKEKYKLLNRVGFHLIDVPHNPSGNKVMREAVDREIAMHAFERALLGPAGQEFIIVSGDGDYVPLIYRLISLGHRVQVWALRPSGAYDVVANYLGVNVINLADVLMESSGDASEALRAGAFVTPQTNVKNKKKAKRKKSVKATFAPQGHQAVPSSISHPDEGKLYYAIIESLDAYHWSLDSAETDEERNTLFHSALGNALRPRLSSVGYSIGSSTGFWIEHLIALHVFESIPGREFPGLGETSAEDAADILFATAMAAAHVALATTASGRDGVIRMSEIAETLLSAHTGDDDMATPLLNLVRFTTGTKQWAHMRYFVRSARALGLLKFEDISRKPTRSRTHGCQSQNPRLMN